MKTYHKCLPCFVEQTLSVLKLTQADEATHEAVLRQALQQLSTIEFDQSPPYMARKLHQLIRQLVNHPDPYHEEKRRYQKLALGLLPQLQQQVFTSADPFVTALKLAIAGNSIDHGVYHAMDEARALDAIDNALHQPLCGDVEALRAAVNSAKNILYLADNAGEIVLDRLLIEQLPLERTIVAVRGKAILNDALHEDAVEAGLADLVTVIDNGDDTPGTDLSLSSPAFREIFDSAELIITKGQGNYETLSTVEAPLFFLLKAKCPVVAADIGCQVNDALALKSHHFTSRTAETN